MNIYEMNKIGENPYRSTSKCSYCRQEGHNVNECPQVSIDYSYWKDYQVPVQSGNPCRWFNADQPKYWGEWYTKCINAMQKQIDYAMKLKQPKQKRASRTKSCGFCGELGHTRRNCDKMETFKADAYRANANWRRKAYDLLVNRLGISVGAAIKVQNHTGWGANTTYHNHIALVTSVNWDKLNLTCANSTWEDQWRQMLRVEVMIDGHRYFLKFDKVDDTVFKPVFRHTPYGNYNYVEKVAPAPKPLDESWVTDYKDAFDWLVKKRSYNRLEEYGIVGLVEKWK